MPIYFSQRCFAMKVVYCNRKEFFDKKKVYMTTT